MRSFEELVAGLSSEKLSFLCRLHPVAARELLVSGNIYELVSEDLVRVCPPLAHPGEDEPTWRHSYKLASRGVRFLEWVRTESGRRAHAGS